MEDRNDLQITGLKNLEKFVIAFGWTIEEPEGEKVLFTAKKPRPYDNCTLVAFGNCEKQEDFTFYIIYTKWKGNKAVFDTAKDVTGIVADISDAREALQILDTGYPGEWTAVNRRNGSNMDMPSDIYEEMRRYFLRKQDKAEQKLHDL